MKKLAPIIVIALLLLAWMFYKGFQYTPTLVYYPPERVTEAIREATLATGKVHEVITSKDKMGCDDAHAACFTFSGVVFVDEATIAHGDPMTSDTYRHEIYHAYEYHALGKPWADTFNHVGWQNHDRY